MVVMGMNPMANGKFNRDEFYFFQWAITIIAPWNYCGNFFFYVLSGKQFRRELAVLFCCRDRSSGAFVLDVFFSAKSLVVHDFNFLLCCRPTYKQSG